METLDIKNFEFFGGTYGNYKVARYGSFIRKNGVKISNKETITVYQGQDDIVFVNISGFSWQHNFIIENMKYDSKFSSGHFNAVIGVHNQKIRNNKIDEFLG